LPLIPAPGQKKVDNSVFSAQVRIWVRDFLADDCVSVIITEANCDEESCSPLETIIAVMDQKPITVHIDKAICDVTQSDVVQAFSSRNHQH
jgi:hypothetical protein